MIQSKSDLKEYIAADNKQFGGRIPGFRDWFLKNERWYIYRLKWHLRHIEYYLNVNKSLLGGKLLLLYHYWRYKHYAFETKITIPPNTCGKGLTIQHCGSYTHVKSNMKIGDNCTLITGTLFGAGKGGDEPVVVGDNCYFGAGCKIIGKITIGNNVIVGANAVVTKDIPDNVVVAGVPARIIRIKNNGKSKN